MNFAFSLNFLEGLFADGNAISTIITGVLLVGGFIAIYFFMIRPQKKKEQEDAKMREEVAVGDEITTIGGIIGKVISVKDETFVLETTKSKTRIRFLKGAIRSVDVRIADTIAAQKAEEDAAAAEAPAEAPVEAPAAEEAPKKKKKK